MRKFFVLAALVLGLASCQTEPEGLNMNADGTIDVMVNVGVPANETRAGGSNSAEGAFANGVLGTEDDNTTLRYILQIYDKDGVASKDRMVEYNDGTEVVFPVRLVPNRKYTFVVWADVVADGKNDTDLHYNTADLTNITLKGNWDAMDETRDAFTATYVVESFTSASDINIELTRPFAKLRVMTTDMKYLTDLGIVPTTATITYKEAHRASFNAYTGMAGDKTLDKEHANFTIASYGEANTAAEYTLFTDYLFVDTVNGDVAKFEMSVYDQNGGLIKYNNFNTDINVKRNYLTTLKGNILTDGGNINVEVKPGFGGETGEIDGKKFITVKNAEELNAAFADDSIDLIIFADNIALDSSVTRAADPVLTVSKEEEVTIDLNGFKLSSTSTQTGKNYNMFDVRGTLTVKNGTVEYQHTGENMNWNNFAEIFYVGVNGTLNLEGVTAKNLGGSDMAYVIDMCNATNITVNINNSTLETTYIPVRVFNNIKTGVNNVKIQNSTLKGKYCFWVQYWISDGRDEATLQQTLNLDIFNSVEGESNMNNFTFANDYDAPVLYGFNEAVYFDEYGQEISFLTPIADGIGLDKDGNYVVTADEGMIWLAANVGKNDGFAGKTILLDTDVDLDLGTDENGENISNNPIGRDPETGDVCAFKGTFDGQGHSIKNLYQSGWAFNYMWGQYGSIGLFSELESATVKNVTLDGFEAKIEGGDIAFIAGSATGTCVFENITITNGNIGTYNNGIGSIIGWSGTGNYTFKDIKIGSDVVLGGLWGSFDSSIGGIVGQAEPGATYNFENVEINCRLDVYNDVIAAYKYYIYRMSGMIIGRCEETTKIDDRNYPDLSKYNITCRNVTINYGDWMNYHYCVVEGKTAWRIEPGYAYAGIPEDHNHETCAMHHELLLPFDGLFGGAQYGVNPIKEYPGVTVNYPASYTPEE